MAPTVEFALRLRRGTSSLSEFALIDTGSALTVFSRDLLRLNGFPVNQASEDRTGIGGVGGHERLFYLEGAVIAVADDSGAAHAINLPRLHFTNVRMPVILGRDVLRSLNAHLSIDFGSDRGHLDLG